MIGAAIRNRRNTYMKIIPIYGDNRHAVPTRIREASRGIVLREGKILLSYETKTDQYFLPGGGREGDESPAACCVREIAEETGILTRAEECFLRIDEFYEEWQYISYYFLCTPVGETEMHLTEREREVGMEPCRISLAKATEIFSRHADYAAENEMKRGTYLRECTALREFSRLYGDK